MKGLWVHIYNLLNTSFYNVFNIAVVLYALELV